VTMKIPSDASEEMWEAFNKWCKESFVNTKSEDDVMIWWNCWRSGYDFGCDVMYNAVRE